MATGGFCCCVKLDSSDQSRVVQYTRTESGRLFGKDDPSSGSRVVVFAEVKKQEIVF